MSATVSRNFLRRGCEAVNSDRIPLQAGPWSMDFQDGDLRRISLERTEVVQRLCVLVRGKSWETLPRTIASLDVATKDRSFSVACECQSQFEDVDFRWTLRIEGSEEGSVRFTFDGTAFSTFWASRIGICVLQSTTEFCGKTISVTAEDGATQQLMLPREIAPWPLFTDAREICYRLGEFPSIRLSLSGDVFEAEDQRNWSDASFKIYSRPLRLPYPYRVEEGSRIQQSACLTLGSHVRTHCPRTSESNVFHISSLEVSRLPKIGVGLSAIPEPTLDGLDLLRTLHPEFLSVEYDFIDPRREDRMAAVGALAKASEIPLEIRVACQAGSRSMDLSLIEQSLRGAAVCRWLIDADSQCDPLAAALPTGAEIYWGSRKGFVEINRNPSIARRGDGVWCSIDPQVHAWDKDSLVENLSAQASLAAQARRLAEGSPLAVSCVSLVSSDAQSSHSDELRMPLFGAAWTLGSFKHLAVSETGSVAYFADAGLAGLMPVYSKHVGVDSSESVCVAVYPVYHVLSDLLEFRGGESLCTRSTHPLRLDGIALRSGGRIRVLLANFSNEEQPVSVRADAICHWPRTRCLDRSNCLEAMKNPARWRALPPAPLIPANGAADVVVPPLGIVTLDGGIQEKA